MDINFPLILFIATAVTGAIVAIDRFWLARRIKNSRQYKIIDYGYSFFPLLLIIFILRSFVFEPFQIPSASMEPGLRSGDFVLVNKYQYGLRFPVGNTKFFSVSEPQRGDVMVFFPPHDDRYFIKRVIGLPGDRIMSRNKKLLINGVPIPHELIDEQWPYRIMRESMGDSAYQTQHFSLKPESDFSEIVKEGHYFVMGDNRDNSRDSRAWGQVPAKHLVGKAVAVWMHWDEFFSIPGFHRNKWL